jgi:Heat induced stress protein YflT domain
MATTNEAKELTPDARTRAGSQPVTGSQSRRVIATYPDYAGAERAVDWLSDQDYAVEHVAIVGKGLRSVEQVSSRMSGGRAALIGAGYGALIGALFALLFGIFFDGPNFGGLLLYSMANGVIFGALLAGMYYVIESDGSRDFVSETSIVADRYEVHADEGVADEAKRVLSIMPGRS